MTPVSLRIGTRRSALARVQAEQMRAALSRHFPDLSLRLVPMQTSGDRLQGAPLAAAGGKALFVKELEEALLAGRIDLAVHSLKDVPAVLPAGLHLGAITEREDPRDALVAPEHGTLARLPAGARIGTGALRRQSQLLRRRPDILVVPLRGNVPTRIEKIEREGLDGVVLAFAGLRRLGLASRVTEVLDIATCVPAVGQGALGLECRADDARTNAMLSRLEHPASAVAAAAERAFLGRLGGGCQVPMGGHATVEDGEVMMRAFVGSPDGKRVVEGEQRGPEGSAAELGRALAEELLDRGAGEILAALGAPGETGER
ncbi:MAG: hydroxymethylbilane synthase [Deltaproteobacteria bacterium]|nr:hydroxymethylbilane synthase [Deltaproteobacteria bacterium]